MKTWRSRSPENSRPATFSRSSFDNVTVPLQNLRETIETQLSRADRSTGRALLPASKDEDEREAATACGLEGRREVAEHRRLTKQVHRRLRQAIFDQIRTLRGAGASIGDIARETGFGPRSIRKWLKFNAPPSVAPRRPSLARPAISWTIYRVAGRKAAYADERCFTRSNSAATPAALAS
jgi:hypothetical protein